MSDKHQFAARLRELRIAANLTQYELAERTGLHRQAIAKLERGERGPAWDTVQVLAKALGLSCEHFMVPPAEPEPERPKGRPRKASASPRETQAAKKRGKKK